MIVDGRFVRKAALRLDRNKRLLSGRFDLPLAGLPSDHPS